MHNESINIFTHLVPFLLAVAALPIILTVVLDHPKTTAYDYFFITLFFAGLLGCLATSSIFHHSERVFTESLCCDYAGIVLHSL